MSGWGFFDGPRTFLGPVRHEGTVWHGRYPLPRLIYQLNTVTTKASSAVYNTVSTFVVPAGQLHTLEGFLTWETWLTILNNSGGDKTFTTKIVMTDGTGTDTIQGAADATTSSSNIRPYTTYARFNTLVLTGGLSGLFYITDNVGAGKPITTTNIDLEKEITFSLQIIMNASHASLKWTHYHTSVYWQSVAP